MRTILFLCESEATALSEFLPLAVWLQSQGLRPMLALASPNKEIESKAISYKIPYIVININRTYYVSTSGTSEVLHDWDDPRAYSYIQKFSPLKFLSRLYVQIKHKIKLKEICVGALNDLEVDVVVLYHESNYLLVPEIVAAAKELRISKIRMQMTRSPPSFLVKTRLKKGEKFIVKGWIKRLYALLLPRHVQEISGKRILFYTPVQALTLKICGMLPERPWHNGDNYADCNFMISGRHIEMERKDGYILPNIKIVGQFSLDQLHRAFTAREVRRRALLQKYYGSRGEEDSVIIVALPQLYEHSILPKDEALRAILYLITSFERIASSRFLISLHPKMDPALYAPLIVAESNCKIVEERLSDILPAGDILICGFESVVSWAIMCHVQPVFLDYYDLGFDANIYGSCRVLKNIDTLEKDLREIINDKSKATQSELLADKRFFLPFDGRSGERIVCALNELGGRHE